MSKDHYVAQTYLRKFTENPDDENSCLCVYKKKEDGTFDKMGTKAVCKTQGWDDLEWFENIEGLKESDFHESLKIWLKQIEPHWNKVIENLEKGIFTNQERWIISGYAAILNIIHPHALDQGKVMMESVLDHVRKILSVNPDLDMPEHLRGVMSDTENFGLEVDEQYQKAFSFCLASDMHWEFFCAQWVLMRNNQKHPFVTSDMPICIMYNNFSHKGNFGFKYLPLTPKLAVLICVNPEDREEKFDVNKYPTLDSLPNMSDKLEVGEINSLGVKKYNELVIKHAERFVFSNEYYYSIQKRVKKLKNYNQKIKHDSLGPYMVSRTIIDKG